MRCLIKVNFPIKTFIYISNARRPAILKRMKRFKPRDATKYQK